VLSAIASLVPITTNSLARLSTKGQPTPMGLHVHAYTVEHPPKLISSCSCWVNAQT
jgi:hypothetical protein